MATAILQEAETIQDHIRSAREDDDRYEVVNGLRIEIPPMSSYAAKVATRLATKLNQHAENEKLGEAIVESLFRLPLTADEGRNRRPDVAFVTSQRWPADRPQPIIENAWDVVPDIAIEVVSPHDLADNQLDKIIEYFQAGVRLVWVVYPKHRLVYVYDTLDSIRVLADTDLLAGGRVLPGFSLPLMVLFDPPPPP
ncbi:MAG: Uma2 family endonuclease [Isosphaeraceae bacterium]|jgi:Uma2 family endonuclease